MRSLMFGWLAGAVALVATLLLVTDIANRQNTLTMGDAVRTLSAAKAAGADVTPSSQPIATASR